MLSKSPRVATALITLSLCASCSLNVPWRDERVRDEVNLAFTLENNLVNLTPTLRIDNRPGRFILGTAAPQTVVDNAFPLGAWRHTLQIQEKESLRISPERVDLRGVADAIIGADAWNGRSISIDYMSGLVTYQKSGIERSGMQVYRFRNEPVIDVKVDDRDLTAIVDTSNPDTLILPGEHGRGTVRVQIAGFDFGPTEVQFANVAQPRVGNRLLSRFLVSIDYGRREVGLWRDPRIGM